MAPEYLDISNSMTWEEGLPRPQWDLIESWIEAQVAPDEWDAAYTAVGRQWLAVLSASLGRHYAVAESDDWLVLAPRTDGLPESLIHLASRFWHALTEMLPGVADHSFAGKKVILALADQENYYRHLSAYYPEGRHGGSGGINIRQGYYHVAVCGSKAHQLETVLAHELTHASLSHLALPLWVEEGLAQMFEQDAAGRAPLRMSEESARRHKRYWTIHGLDEFWRGDGFLKPGKIQGLCYQLAEILVRLLIEEHRPGWFGLAKGKPRRLLEFLRSANTQDCGASAAETHLDLTLSTMAGWFLGPGEWGPSL